MVASSKLTFLVPEIAQDRWYVPNTYQVYETHALLYVPSQTFIV